MNFLGLGVSLSNQSGPEFGKKSILTLTIRPIQLPFSRLPTSMNVYERYTTVLLWIWLWLAIVICNPLPSSGNRSRDMKVREEPLGRRLLYVTELYPKLPLQDIPTTIADDVILTNSSITRYGYLMGRPMTRFLNNWFGTTILAKFMSKLPPILHWGILISKELPLTNRLTDSLPKPGTKVSRPETGLIFELRNSVNTGLIYLDIKNWETYDYRQNWVRYQGTLNKTDDQLIALGRAYIQHVGKEGFHDFYRNCQIFSTWYIKALWPKASLATRADQMFWKMLWWFRDWGKTLKWGADNLKRLLGLKVDDIEEIDSSAQFVNIEL